MELLRLPAGHATGAAPCFVAATSAHEGKQLHAALRILHRSRRLVWHQRMQGCDSTCAWAGSKLKRMQSR